MFLLSAEKLAHFMKFPFKHEDGSSSPMRRFRSKTSDALAQILPKSGEIETIHAEWFNNCFKAIHAANTAFAELVVEVEYPMSKWGAAAIDEHLGYTLSLMDMLNSITSCVSHLNMVKISMLHGLSLVENSPNSMKMGKASFKVEKCGRGNEIIRYGSARKESVILEALMELKKVVFVAIGFVLSGLWNAVREFSGGVGDSLEKEVLEKGVVELENAVLVVEIEANSLFFEVLASRNKVVDGFRFAA